MHTVNEASGLTAPIGIPRAEPRSRGLVLAPLTVATPSVGSKPP